MSLKFVLQAYLASSNLKVPFRLESIPYSESGSRNPGSRSITEKTGFPGLDDSPGNDRGGIKNSWSLQIVPPTRHWFLGILVLYG